MRSAAAVTLCVLLAHRLSSGTRISGTISHEHRGGSVELFYLSKFGVAAENPLFVFGAVQRRDLFIQYDSQMALVLLPQDTTNQLMNNYLSLDCSRLFTQVLNDSKYVAEDKCVGGSMDYVRTLPCERKHSNACNQPHNIPIIGGNNDFTYHVESSPSTQYYYLFMLACVHNITELDVCEWGETEESYVLYDITLANSNPENNTVNPFTYQFPYELQGVLILQMIFSVVYFILLTVHLLVHSGVCAKVCPKPGGACKMHRLPVLFTVSLFFEFVHILLDLIHYSAYAGNGYGAVWCKYLGEVANQVSDWLLILVLILIGKGWMVTTCALRWRKLTFGIWGAYVFFFTMYFVWTVVQEQVFPLTIFTEHTFQSWPGGLYLTYRLFLLIYILYEMRQVYLVENRPVKLKLYFVMAFLYVAWFSYLPFIVFVIAFINPLLKLRVVLTFVLTFDFLANLGMVLLFAPRWAQVLFQFDSYLNELQEKSLKSGTKGLKNFNYGSSGKATNVI